MTMYPELNKYIETFDHSSIDDKRQELLSSIAEELSNLHSGLGGLKLMFVCTHNSRRSHISQLWAAALAEYYHIDQVKTFSAGTEATAFNPRAVAAMKRAGFKITSNAETDNPKYEIRFAEDQQPIIGFSKSIEDSTNPKEGFVAFLTCSSADNDCPMVEGAVKRYSLHYRDPKEADDTPEESARYAERCHQIGNEISYLFSRIAQHG